LAGMRGRFIKPVEDFRYYDFDYQGHSNTNLTLFNENRIDWDKPLVLVEGGFDTMAVFRWYGNVASPQSASMSIERIKRLSLAPEVLCFFDNDKAGQLITDKIRKHIGNETIVKQIFYPGSTQEKDASDLPSPLLASVLSDYVEIRDFLDSP
jgi:5S rRNA maturation endonuclease (ribonuclease M5)